MKKNKLLLLCCFMLALSTSGFAQNRGQLSVKEMGRTGENTPFCLKHGLGLTPPVRGKDVKPTLTVAHKESPAGKTLWGNVVLSKNWKQDNPQYGMYGFNTASPSTVNQLSSQKQPIARNGSAQHDGVFYGLDADFSDYEDYGFVYLNRYAYDAQTWDEVEKPQFFYDRNEMIALETAQAADGTVYGLFYKNEAMDALEWGIADFKTMTRTSIGNAAQAYVALGITSDNELYGVAVDGKLYSINIANGAETEIGSTGVSLSIPNSNGKTYGQSGEIDQRDNTFYWTAVDSEGNAGLYIVDLNTGRAEKKAEMPEQIYALTIPAAFAKEGAPDAATNLDVQLNNGANSGTIVFTVPTKTYNGQDLGNEKLSYTVHANNTEIANGSNITPGEHIIVNMANLPEGMVKFYVTISNSIGKSPKAKIEKWVGIDTPTPPTDVVLEIDNNGTATLTWKAPTVGVHDGYVGNMKYNIYRIVGKNSYKVATGWQNLTFTETLIKGEEYKAYLYQVVAVNEKFSSNAASSNPFGFGNATELPYFEPFKDKTSMDKYSVINTNNDKSYWTWAKDFEAVRCNWSSSEPLDDWLITPPLHFKQGKSYKVAYLVRGADGKKFTERIEVKLGESPSVKNMTETLLQPTDIKNDTFEEYAHIIKAEKDYNAYIGFHAISKPAQFLLYVDSITVDIIPDGKAPGRVNNLRAIPQADGLEIINIAFTTPTKTADGSPLQSIERIELRRGNDIIKTFHAPSVGQELSFSDSEAAKGKNAYSLIAYNEHEAGEKAVVVGFAGIDIPKSPRPIKITDSQNAITLSWDAVTSGINEGVLGNQLGYLIYNITEGGYLGNELDSISHTSYTININTDEGEQTVKHWGVFASNATDQSEISIASLVVGSPQTLPYEESFKAGAAQTFVWKNKQEIIISTDESVDGDNGCLTFKGELKNGALGMSKITFPDADHPILSFAHSCNEGSQATLKVYALCPDGNKVLLKDIDYRATDAQGGWKTEKIDLSSLKPQRYISIQFVYNGQTETDKVSLDAIAVRNALGHDLAISMNVQEDVSKGSLLKVPINVSNIGVETATDYQIKVMLNEQEFKVLNGMTIEPYSTPLSYEVEIPISVFEEENVLKLKASVEYRADQATDNNVANAVVQLNQSVATPVENLTGSVTDESIQLRWEAPSNPTEYITETFEEYTPWSIQNVGQWTMYDLNGNNTYQIQNFPFPHAGEAYSFIVFNPGKANINYAGWTPHSGSQMMVSFCSGPASGSTEFPNTNHWLISPELPGVEQTVTFYAARPTPEEKPETIELLYSTSSREFLSFKKVDEWKIVKTPSQSKDFESVMFDIPNGSKYFAIRHTTNNGFALMVDDIKYTAAGSAPTGYNIYCEKKQIGYVEGDTSSFSIALEGAIDQYKDKNYAVTALYANGTESTPVQWSISTGVKKVGNGIKPFDIYTVNGTRVKSNTTNTHGLKKGIYVTSDNRKIIIM